MSKPIAGDAIALRWVWVMREIKRPFVVDFTSNKEDASGVVVPMPAAPDEGKIFVCAVIFPQKKLNKKIVVT